jgi:hypothetical protein
MISSLQSPPGSSFINQALTSHLLQLGYPQKSLDSINRCGQSTGFSILRACNCENKIFPSKHRCNLRICPVCAKRRKGRIVHKYLPFLKSLAQDKTYFIYFLTISPKNYTDLDYGLRDIKKSFSKFLRHNYIKERIKAGLYVIESKGGEGNWNIHIHAIVYGRWLDNRVRGECLDCGQNLLKYDKITKRFFCASHKCNSQNVLITEGSKLSNLYHQSSKREARVHIQRQGSSLYSLNYMCKYISANKEDFFTDKDTAQYIYSIQDKRLISSFGLFYHCIIPKYPIKCVKCGGEIHFSNDREVIFQIEQDLQSRPIPKVQQQESLGLFLVPVA